MRTGGVHTASRTREQWCQQVAHTRCVEQRTNKRTSPSPSPRTHLIDLLNLHAAGRLRLVVLRVIVVTVVVVLRVVAVAFVIVAVEEAPRRHEARLVVGVVLVFRVSVELVGVDVLVVGKHVAADMDGSLPLDAERGLVLQHDVQ